MVAGEISQRKLDYRARLEGYFREYKNILMIGVDMVGSKQMQTVRMALRGRAVILMGKNTIMRKVIREMAEENPQLQALLPHVFGNIGFVFTNADLAEIRTEIMSHKVPAAARPGVIAPSDVTIPAGPTGLDPGQTAFFQALNIATKIQRGAIEIINPVQLIKTGEKVSPSAVSLLAKLNIQPFFFGIEVKVVYDDGSVYDSALLDMTEADILNKFFGGVSKLTCVSLAIGHPTLSTIPHSFARAFRKAVALAVETEITFKEAEPYKEFLSDPDAYAAKHGISAGGGGGGGGGAADAPKEVEKEEEEEEESADAGFGGLFD